jgi:hypothetical protein
VADPVYAFGSRQSRSGKNQRRSLRNEPKFSAASEAVLRATLEFRGRLRRPQYGLRVGDIRVFYDLSGTTVEVLAIVAKSEAESWLAQFGNPE